MSGSCCNNNLDLQSCIQKTEPGTYSNNKTSRDTREGQRMSRQGLQENLSRDYTGHVPLS